MIGTGIFLLKYGDHSVFSPDHHLISVVKYREKAIEDEISLSMKEI